VFCDIPNAPNLRTAVISRVGLKIPQPLLSPSYRGISLRLFSFFLFPPLFPVVFTKLFELEIVLQKHRLLSCIMPSFHETDTLLTGIRYPTVFLTTMPISASVWTEIMPIHYRHNNFLGMNGGFLCHCRGGSAYFFFFLNFAISFYILVSERATHRETGHDYSDSVSWRVDRSRSLIFCAYIGFWAWQARKGFLVLVQFIIHES
jgi:hypothetical protein